MIRNIIFDWSGTLVDDLPAVLQATNYVFRQAGLPEMSLDKFRAEFSLPFRRFYDRYTPHIPMDQLEHWFHGHFRQVQDSVVELPHAREFLEFCQSHKLRTFVLSTVNADHFRVQAQRTGFEPFIERPYLEVHDKREKIGEILTQNQLDPRETLFIGDMQHDIDTAKMGGVHSCAVLTGYNTVSQLRESKPDWIVEHLGELQDRLKRHHFELRESPGNHLAPSLPIVTVGALIFNLAGQVLMVRTRKWSHLWGIPGGKTQYGETSEEALRREIKEETNLDVDNIKFILVQDCIESAEFYRKAHFVLLNYICQCLGTTEVTLNDEAEAYDWMALEDALKMEINQPTRILIESVQARSAGRENMEATPPERTHG